MALQYNPPSPDARSRRATFPMETAPRRPYITRPAAAGVAAPSLSRWSATVARAISLSRLAAPLAVVAGLAACGSDSTPASPEHKQVTLRAFTAEALTTGKRLLLMFFGFAFIGYFLNGLIPSAWVSAVFGPGSVYSIPLAATLGLPLYVNTEASLPLVRALLDGGMSQGDGSISTCR